MKTIERIKLFIDYKQVSLTKFDKMLEAGTGYIGKQIKKNGSVGSDILEKIISVFPDLSANWLLTGEGKMIKTGVFDADTPATGIQFASQNAGYIAHTPDSTKRSGVTKLAKSDPPTDPPTTFLTPRIISVNNDKEENILYVPVRAAAGYLKGFSDPDFMETLPAFNLPGLNKRTYRAFQLDGDSMYPTLEDKEIIIGEWVEKIEDIREDHVHVLVTKNRGVIVKRLLNRVKERGYILAKSDAMDNRNQYQPYEVYPDEIQEIWYGVSHINFKFKHPTDMYKRVNNLEADMAEIMRILKAGNILPGGINGL
ncbi:helix-turn-helix transcriptional regulator [Mucilaginibacter rubeus]|uniref:Uncharacterized protein n=1 Tax=Mucilaginibacter rubeus TaxID=2027860 RepID=A0A5C1I690_9SPHI|nr:S24/S26 family peptidase [Mucilaginibacter rubeus]QEM13443.1 hypothetical protein DEO27_026685 [Mucilaginibacter rubeus]